jgi:ubiquinone/menaquinone biosynthesis C-methylase UbiE
MSLLDCGCGDGATTVELATIVAPGRVVGIDLDPSQIERARALAAERRVNNVRFESGDVCALPLLDGTFDAVFAHTVLQHLRDPVQALREIRRTLKPGGIIGVRDDDWGGYLQEPFSPRMELGLSLFLRAWAANGGQPFFGRRHRALLREAGFVRCLGSSSTEWYASPEATRFWAEIAEAQVRNPAFARVVLEQGWADPAMLDAIVVEYRQWGECDDTFVSRTFCEAVGWKG